MRDGVSLTIQTKNKGKLAWAVGWKWTDVSPTSRTAIASIGACGTPACLDGSLGALCPCTSKGSTVVPDKAGAVTGGVSAEQACTTAVNGAATAGAQTLLKRHLVWWHEYWPESFVSLPVTRIEGFYYAEMYRFPSADRVGLHGLMGAFGPSGMFDLWPDDVWYLQTLYPAGIPISTSICRTLGL